MYFMIMACQGRKTFDSEHTSWEGFEKAFDHIIREFAELGFGYIDMRQGDKSGSDGYLEVDGTNGLFVVRAASEIHKFEGLVVNPSIKDLEDYVLLSVNESYKKFTTDNIEVAGQMVKSLFKSGTEINLKPNVWQDV